MREKIDIEKLKFPIGEFKKPKNISSNQIDLWINEIKLFPSRLNDLVDNLTDTELNLKYRPNGWTIKQVVHHCADSHMNSFIRFKLALTEDTPTIKPYYEDRWAEFTDVTESNISASLKIIDGLHTRWSNLLSSLTKNGLEKQFIHPEYNKRISITENIGFYAWHSNHHLAHIEQAINNRGEF